jgi:hypothetical protein
LSKPAEPPSAAPPPGASNADRAGKAPPPPEPKRIYHWNLGAGVGFGGNEGALGGAVVYAPIVAGVPSFRLGLERRIVGGLWLMLNGSFYFTTGEAPPADQSAPEGETVKKTLLATGGVVGIRQAMTSGIVETSVTLGFRLGYQTLGGDTDQADTALVSAAPGSYAITYGFVGGLAVERELIEALALRLSANVVSLTWMDAKAVSRFDGVPPERVKSTTFAVDLIPAIDVRFYF